MCTLQWPSSRGSGIISLYVKYLQCIRLMQTDTLFGMSQNGDAPAAVAGKVGDSLEDGVGKPANCATIQPQK